MALRFQKRIKIAPGLRVNVSKGGVSTSIGKPGATVNIGKKGVQGTVGVPGTGLSYRRKLGGQGNDQVGDPVAPGRSAWSWVVAFGVVGGVAALVYWVV